MSILSIVFGIIVLLSPLIYFLAVLKEWTYDNVMLLLTPYIVLIFCFIISVGLCIITMPDQAKKVIETKF